MVECQVVALVVMGSNPIALPFLLAKTVLKSLYSLHMLQEFFRLPMICNKI